MPLQNTHLNLFRHYSASEDQQVLENNLTRALALCLQHDALFLYSLLGAITGRDELNRHLHLTDAADRLVINVQQPVRELGPSTTLYPVAITVADLKVADYERAVAWRNESPVTDLVIGYKDVLIIVEIKRTDEDCLGQLKGQVEAYQESLGEDKAIVKPVSTVKWARIVRMAANTRNLHQLTGHSSVYVSDFVQFIQYHYPHWDEVLPFASIPFAPGGAINEAALYKRLHYIQQQAYGERLKWFNDRVAMPADVPWASEIITHPELDARQQGHIVVNVWPGNTKQQGWPLFSRSLEWAQCSSLVVGTSEYAVVIEKYLKFSHFNRYVFEVHVPDKFMNRQSFETYAGKWERDSWSELEAALERDIGERWQRQKEHWHRHFINSDRSYTAVSLGFALSVYVPYTEFQQLDIATEDWQPAAGKLQQVIHAMKTLINGQRDK